MKIIEKQKIEEDIFNKKLFSLIDKAVDQSDISNFDEQNYLKVICTNFGAYASYVLNNLEEFDYKPNPQIFKAMKLWFEQGMLIKE